MKIRQTTFALAAIAGVSLLAACGGSDSSAPESEVAPAAEEVVLDNGMTPKEQIELRQGQLKKLGKAFKTISDQLKASEPDMAAIRKAPSVSTAFIAPFKPLPQTSATTNPTTSSPAK